MAATTRRHLLKAAAFGGVSATGLAVLSSPGIMAEGGGQKPGSGDEHAHDNRPLTDKRAHTVVSFGQWDVNPANPLDREPINTEPENRTRNIHLHLPFEAEVDAGGAVSFIISGVHQILIYGPGVEMDALKAAYVAAGSPVIALPPPLPPMVDYAVGRVYRGLDPFFLQYVPPAVLPPQTPNNMVVDRVESVNFKAPGRYLVVCGVKPHFDTNMHGYVDVKA
jgi:plastocyanin